MIWKSEPHDQHQKVSECCYHTVKCLINTIIDCTGAPTYVWLLSLVYVRFILNHTYDDGINGTPIIKSTGSTSDISTLLRFRFSTSILQGIWLWFPFAWHWKKLSLGWYRRTFWTWYGLRSNYLWYPKYHLSCSPSLSWVTHGIQSSPWPYLWGAIYLFQIASRHK